MQFGVVGDHLENLSASAGEADATDATSNDVTSTYGDLLKRHEVRRGFNTACRVLGHDWLRTLTIHHGRHTFISQALAGGQTLAEFRAAAGTRIW